MLTRNDIFSFCVQGTKIRPIFSTAGYNTSICQCLRSGVQHIMGRRGRDRMEAGFTTTYAISAYHHLCCEFESRSGRGVQHYMKKFVSDLRQVGCFLWNIVESGVKHHQTNKQHLISKWVANSFAEQVTQFSLTTGTKWMSRVCRLMPSSLHIKDHLCQHLMKKRLTEWSLMVILKAVFPQSYLHRR